MKNLLIAGLAALVCALAIGVEPIQRFLNETFRLGTLAGIEACFDYSESELLSEEALRAMCASKFETRLFSNELATGRAGPRMSQNAVIWGGNLRNETSGYVTTWIRIEIGIYNESGERSEFFEEISIWVAPLEDADFELEFREMKPEDIESLGFCELDDSSPTNCMDWGVTEVKGVSI